MAGYTETFNTLVSFRVIGIDTLEKATRALAGVDDANAALARTSARSLSGASRNPLGDPRQAEQDLRRVFQGSEQAMKSFAVGLETGTRRGRDLTQTLNTEYRELFTNISKLQRLQAAVATGSFKLPDRPSANLAAENAILQAQQIAGQLRRNPTGGGFYAASAQGQPIPGSESRTRQGAVDALIREEMAGARTAITRYLAELSGVVAGGLQVPERRALPAGGGIGDLGDRARSLAIALERSGRTFEGVVRDASGSLLKFKDAMGRASEVYVPNDPRVPFGTRATVLPTGSPTAVPPAGAPYPLAPTAEQLSAARATGQVPGSRPVPETVAAGTLLRNISGELQATNRAMLNEVSQRFGLSLENALGRAGFGRALQGQLTVGDLQKLPQQVANYLLASPEQRATGSIRQFPLDMDRGSSFDLPGFENTRAKLAEVQAATAGTSRFPAGDAAVIQQAAVGGESAPAERVAEENRLLAEELRLARAAIRDQRAAARELEKAQLATAEYEKARREVAGLGGAPLSPYGPQRVPGLETLFKTNDIGRVLGTYSDFGDVEELTEAARLKRSYMDRAEQKRLQAEAVTREALQVEQAAAAIQTRTTGGVRPATTGEIYGSYREALETARPGLESRGTFQQVGPAVERLAVSATRGAESIDRLRQHETARLETERIRTNYLQRGPLGQQIGGFYEDFRQGFRGRRELPYGEQIGQVAKFSILYGTAYQALFAFQQGLQAAIDNSIAYNAALVELSIATGSTKQEVGDLGNNLGKIASAYGFAPAEGVTAGARGVGIFGLADATGPEQQLLATSFARATSQLAFITNRTMEQVGQDLGAITQGFGLGPSSLGYVQDLDAYFSKQFGSTAGGTLETTAQIGSLGAEAGFSIEEVQAFSSLLQSRTGQTPAATAGFLSQFFGRSGDPALRQKFAELGIDISVPFRDQIEQLSELLESNTLGEGLRLQIINAFGRGRSGQAAAIIAQEFGSTARTAEEAKTEAGGAADEQFQQRLNSVGGQLKQLAGDLLALGTAVGDSGLLDAFGATVIVFDQLVEAATVLTETFNLLPRWLRDAGIALGAFTLATRTAAGRSAIGSVLGSTARGQAIGESLGYTFVKGADATIPKKLDWRSLFGATPAPKPQEIPFEGGAWSFGAAKPTTPPTSRFAQARTVGAAGVGAVGSLLFNPVTGAIAGLLAIGALKNDMDDFRLATSNATATLGQIDQIDPDALDQAAKALREQATAVDDAQSFLLNIATVGGAERTADDQVDLLSGRADYVEQAAERERAYREAQAKARSTSVFGSVEVVDDVVTGMQQLAAAGADPIEQFNLLQQALRNASESAALLTADLELLPGRFARSVSGIVGGVDKEELGIDSPNWFESLNNKVNIVPRLLGAITGEGTELSGEGAYSDADLQLAFQQSLDPAVIEEDLRARLAQGPMSMEEFDAYVAELVAGMDLSQIGGAQTTTDEQGKIKTAFTPLLQEALSSYITVFDPSKVYNSAELTRLLNEALIPGFQAEQSTLTDLGYDQGSSKQIASVKDYLKTLKKDIKTAPDADISQMSTEITKTEQLLAESMLIRLENQRLAQQDLAKGDRATRAIGRAFFQTEINVALRSKSLRLVREVIARGTRNQVAIIKEEVRGNVLAARTAYQAALVTFSTVAAADEVITMSSKAALYALQAARKQLEKFQRKWKLLNEALKTTIPTGEISGVEDVEDAGDEGPTQAQINAARAIAEAARRGGEVAKATAELQSAKADLAAAEKNTVEYYQALAAVYEAQRALAEAIRNYRIDKFLLSSDITDPVVEARAELRRARQTLAYDKRQGSSPELITADRLEVKRQEAALEATKFQQWFSDLQTAEQLERITHASYIRHLERRRERLASIKNRTRQEQEQLDQVDAALMEAKRAMAGQFNLGDINVPTPYEVRRFIEETVKRTKQAAENEGKDQGGKPGGADGSGRDGDRDRDRDRDRRRDADGGRTLAGSQDRLTRAIVELTDAIRGGDGEGRRRRAAIEDLEGPKRQREVQNVYDSLTKVTNNNTVTRNVINIDGADTAQVMRILTDVLGGNAIKTTATATGKR